MAGGSAGKQISDPSGDTWIENRKTLMVLMIVLGSSLSLPYFRQLNVVFPHLHAALVACMAGVIVTLATYLPMAYADSKYAFSNAVLLGLLVAEFAVYGAPTEYPAPVVISFFFFMYFMGRNDADHLWPHKEHYALKDEI